MEEGRSGALRLDRSEAETVAIVAHSTRVKPVTMLDIPADRLTQARQPIEDLDALPIPLRTPEMNAMREVNIAGSPPLSCDT